MKDKKPVEIKGEHAPFFIVTFYHPLNEHYEIFGSAVPDLVIRL